MCVLTAPHHLLQAHVAGAAVCIWAAHPPRWLPVCVLPEGRASNASPRAGHTSFGDTAGPACLVAVVLGSPEQLFLEPASLGGWRIFSFAFSSCEKSCATPEGPRRGR